MDLFTLNYRLPRVISLLACCSIGWLAYTRYVREGESFRHSRTKIIPVQPKLENLSFDVLLEIMIYLEWHELLKLRQVSTGLKLATHQRVLWHNMIKSSPSRFMLHKKMQMCSSQELEDAFLSKQKADHRWVNPGTPHRVQERIGLGEIRSITYKILPGGRWLIKLESSTEIRYIDLNSPGSVWRSLIPPPLVFDTTRLLPWILLDAIFDLDLDAEHLTFNIANITALPGVRGKNPAVQFVIWRCTSDFDADGREIGLKALKLSTFEERHFPIRIYGIHLRGDFITYTNLDGYQPVVVDWTMADGHTETLPRFCFGKNYDSLQNVLLSPKTKQIFVRSARQWDVISWDNLLPTTGHSVDCSTISVEIRSTNESVPSFKHAVEVERICEDNIVTFVGHEPSKNEYVHVSIQTDGSDPSSPLKLTMDTICAPGARNSRCLFTQSRVLLLLDNTEVNTGFYNLDGNGRHQPLNLFHWGKVLPSVSVADIVLDDVSGRCLILARSEHLDCYLVDL